MIASVIHQKEFLVESLPDNHPLFTTPLFSSGVISDLSQAIRLNDESTGLTTSGNPEIISLRKDLTKPGEEIIELPRETANIILERVGVDGVQPVSREDFENFRHNMQLSISNLITDSLTTMAIYRSSNTNNIDGTRNSFHPYVHNQPIN